MAMARKVEIIMRETIKPSSPTPHHLRNFKISLFDQLAMTNFSHIVFFYTSEGDGNGDSQEAKATQRSRCLRKSLSKTLTRFYPLAGRIKDNVSIECNDEGVDYVEARVLNCRALDVLQQPQLDEMKLFLPNAIESTEAKAVTGCLLIVQVSFFECGGTAISASTSHKIFDGSTTGMFLKAWATTTAFESNEGVFPVFNAASIFPPRDDISIMLPVEEWQPSKSKRIITRRCLFNASKLAALKAKVASTNVPQPTRVEAVSALIWKCALMATRSNNNLVSSPRRPSMLNQVVNLRDKLVGSSLQENSFGNLVWLFSATTDEEREIELPSLVDKLRRGIKSFQDESVKKIQENESYLTICESFKETGNMIRSDNIDLYFFSSLIRFPLYEIDFGWGKPTWVNVVSSATHNNVLLMSTRGGGGIEAHVTLKEEDMAVFERNQELLQYASLDPSALNMD